MSRPREFTRAQVLKKAIPVFWEHGFADTGLHELEKATGVNKSGLYSEFKNKKDLFLACLEYYLDHQSDKAILSAKPAGWANVEKLLRLAITCSAGPKGCFAVHSTCEFAILPAQARKLVAENHAALRRLLVSNIRAEKPRTDPEILAELITTFISGISVEQNFNRRRISLERKIHTFMNVLRSQ